MALEQKISSNMEPELVPSVDFGHELELLAFECCSLSNPYL